MGWADSSRGKLKLFPKQGLRSRVGGVLGVHGYGDRCLLWHANGHLAFAEPQSTLCVNVLLDTPAGGCGDCQAIARQMDRWWRHNRGPTRNATQSLKGSVDS